MTAPLDPEVKLSREVERLRQDNAHLRLLNKKLAIRGGGYDEFIAELRDVLCDEKGYSYKPSLKVKPVAPIDKSHEEIACAAVSDLHLTENVNSQDSNGINSYNSIIASNRLWEHTRKIISILNIHKSLYKLKYIWSPLLGDIINGTIHNEQIYTNDLTDPAAVVLGSRLLGMFYTELKQLGLPINIDAIHGNHPRTTIKMPTKKQAHTNLDWLIYETLADRFSKDDQVSISIHTGQIGMRKLFGWRYIFEHGIGVKNGKEDSFESSIRAIFDSPTYRQATGLEGASFDHIVIGNLHHPKFLENIVVNGSYVGSNELGQSWRLQPVRAQQMLWGVSKRHVRTWSYGVDMTDIISSKVENPFSDYTAWFIGRHGNKV